MSTPEEVHPLTALRAQGFEVLESSFDDDDHPGGALADERGDPHDAHASSTRPPDSRDANAKKLHRRSDAEISRLFRELTGKIEVALDVSGAESENDRARVALDVRKAFGERHDMSPEAVRGILRRGEKLLQRAALATAVVAGEASYLEPILPRGASSVRARAYTTATTPPATRPGGNEQTAAPARGVDGSTNARPADEPSPDLLLRNDGAGATSDGRAAVLETVARSVDNAMAAYALGHMGAAFGKRLAEPPLDPRLAAPPPTSPPFLPRPVSSASGPAVSTTKPETPGAIAAEMRDTPTPVRPRLVHFVESLRDARAVCGDEPMTTAEITTDRTGFTCSRCASELVRRRAIDAPAIDAPAARVLQMDRFEVAPPWVRDIRTLVDALLPHVSEIEALERQATRLAEERERAWQRLLSKLVGLSGTRGAP